MATKERRIKAEFVLEDGKTVARMDDDTLPVAVRYSDPSDPSNRVDVPVVDVNNDFAYPADTIRRLLTYGIRQRSGDAYAGAKADEMSADDILAKVNEMVGMWRDNQWTSEREGGVRVGDWAEAWYQMKVKKGALKDGETVESMAQRLRSEPETFKNLRALATVKAAADQIKAKRSAQAAKGLDEEIPE